MMETTSMGPKEKEKEGHELARQTSQLSTDGTGFVLFFLYAHR